MLLAPLSRHPLLWASLSRRIVLRYRSCRIVLLPPLWPDRATLSTSRLRLEAARVASGTQMHLSD